ncbi:MAG: hypothetical protein WAU39_04635 [Polyangiales bacterium]
MDLKSVEIRLEPEEAAKIQAVAEQVGKADFGWEGNSVDPHGRTVAITVSSHQLRKIDTTGA